MINMYGISEAVINNTKHHGCMYCGDWFIPSKRNHKYCSGSCRTKSCRERTEYGGGNVIHRDRTTNTSLMKQINLQSDNIKNLEIKITALTKTVEKQTDLLEEILKKQKDLSEKQNWTTVVGGIAPFLPPLIERISDRAVKGNLTFDAILADFGSLIPNTQNPPKDSEQPQSTPSTSVK